MEFFAGLAFTAFCTVMGVRYTTGKQINALGNQLEKKIDDLESKADGRALAIEWLILNVNFPPYGSLRSSEQVSLCVWNGGSS